MRINELFGDFVRDLRYAARGLARRPAFTAVVVLTLAIGIGATTAIFSAVNTLILRPLPYERPDELMRVSLEAPPQFGRPRQESSWSYRKAALFRNRQAPFDEVALYAWQSATITSGEPELTRFEFVSASYLKLLGVAPAIGRDFDPAVDDHPGAEPQVILSDALWRRRLSADPNVIGKKISLDRVPYTIVGVAPPGFLGLTGEGQLFAPITTKSANELNQAQYHWLEMVARRKLDVTDAQIGDAVKTLGRQINEALPAAVGAWGGTARPLDDSRVAPLIERSLLILFGAAAFVLLIACVNVANLLIGRASARRREIAVRLAIGAGRGRLVRLLLAESMLLAIGGGAAGIAVAAVGIRALAAVDPAALRLSRFSGLGSVTFSSISLDWATLTFALAVVMVIGLMFGLLPALHAARASLAEAMKNASADRRRGLTSGRRGLVVAEVAIAVVLLAGSGLMIRSLSKLLAVDPGFDARNVLTVRLTMPPGGTPRDSLPGFYTQLLERLRAIPGVTHASLSGCAPLGGRCGNTPITFMQRPPVPDDKRPLVEIHWATAEWFATLRVPVKRGRLFAEADRANTPKVAMINEAAAKRFWPDEDPIGKRIALGLGDFADGAEVIGVVGDVRQIADSAALPAVHISYIQAPRSTAMIFLRAARDPASLGAEARRAIRELAPASPVYDMKTLAERTASATAQARFSATLLALFAATALSLALIGVYGVMSLAVSARTREIGIRIALGADRGRVQRLVVSEGIALVAGGAAIGLAGAFVSTRVLENFLFELEPSDPITYVAILLLLGTAAVAASWLPARRASHVDPVNALRAE